MACDVAVRDHAPVSPSPSPSPRGSGPGRHRRRRAYLGALVPLSLVALSSLAPVVGSDLSQGRVRILLGALTALTLFALATGPRGSIQLALGLTATVAADSVLPWQLAWWPLPGLVGVLAYVLARTLASEQTPSHPTGLRLGRLAAVDVWMVVGVVLTSASVLLVFFRLAPPRIGTGASLLTTLPAWSVVVAGVAFALVNALVEEVLFRGAVLHHLGRVVGRWQAVGVQALAFGMLHLNGYPYGPVGVGLASVYGVLLGALRLRSGGLLAPWIAHVVTDLFIFVLIVKTAT